MRIITLVIGNKGAGKSKWILEKKDERVSPKTQLQTYFS